MDRFGKLVHYSKSHLSKVENGVKGPSVELARLCDAVLDCRGTLALLVDHGTGAAPSPSTNRRSLLAAGLLSAAGITGVEFGPPGSDVVVPAPPARADVAALATFRACYGQIRELGQVVDARMLLPVVAAHAQTIRRLAGELRGADQRRGWQLVADYAEYAGWMAQESGDDRAARWWTNQAVRFAAAAGDGGMSAYALVRMALVTMYLGDARETVSLAQRAQRAGCRPRIRGLAAQREAQGHALANRQRECQRALDRARGLLEADPPTAREAVIGSANVVDLVQAAAGWSWYELGRASQAADLLEATVSAIPVRANRARARFAARQALALVTAGRLEEAVEAADRVLDAQTQLRSATIAADLRRLEQVLRRRPRHRAANRLSLRLHETRMLTATACRARPGRWG